jgi:hypothetical protein
MQEKNLEMAHEIEANEKAKVFIDEKIKILEKGV